IYVVESASSTVEVIDGATEGASTPIITGFSSPTAVAVHPATNKIYVANGGDGTVTVINGADNTTTPVTVGTNPVGITIDIVRNQVYVANQGSDSVSVIDGASNAVTAT